MTGRLKRSHFALDESAESSYYAEFAGSRRCGGMPCSAPAVRESQQPAEHATLLALTLTHLLTPYRVPFGRVLTDIYWPQSR